MFRPISHLLTLILVFIAILHFPFIGVTVSAQDSQPGTPQIVYLVDSGNLDTNSGLRSPERIQSLLQAQLATNWQQVLEFNTQRPLQALVIDASALHLVDRPWVADAYNNGVVIAGFNIPVNDFASLVGNPCLTNSGFASEPYLGNYFIIASTLTLGSDLDEVARVRTAESSCGTVVAQNVTGLVAGGSAQSTNALDSEQDLQTLQGVLNTHIVGINRIRMDYFAGAFLRLLNIPAPQ